MPLLETPPRDKIDAVIAPRPFRGLEDPAGDGVFKKIFGPLFANGPLSPQSFVLLSNDRYYLAPTSTETLNFPTLHPLASAPRYDWFVVAETDNSPTLARPVPVLFEDIPKGAVAFGFLKDEAKVEQPSAAAKAAHIERYEGWFNAKARLSARYNELLKKRAEAGLDSAEAEELAAIEAGEK